MVVVGKHFPFLLIVVYWEIPTYLLTNIVFAPLPTAAKFYCLTTHLTFASLRWLSTRTSVSPACAVLRLERSGGDALLFHCLLVFIEPPFLFGGFQGKPKGRPACLSAFNAHSWEAKVNLQVSRLAIHQGDESANLKFVQVVHRAHIETATTSGIQVCMCVCRFCRVTPKLVVVLVVSLQNQRKEEGHPGEWAYEPSWCAELLEWCKPERKDMVWWTPKKGGDLIQSTFLTAIGLDL